MTTSEWQAIQTKFNQVSVEYADANWQMGAECAEIDLRVRIEDLKAELQTAHQRGYSQGWEDRGFSIVKLKDELAAAERRLRHEAATHKAEFIRGFEAGREYERNLDKPDPFGA